MENKILKNFTKQEIEFKKPKRVKAADPQETDEKIKEAFKYLKWVGASYIPLECSTNAEDYADSEGNIPDKYKDYKDCTGYTVKKIAKKAGLSVDQVNELKSQHREALASFVEENV